jgi:hypothetical protein
VDIGFIVFFCRAKSPKSGNTFSFTTYYSFARHKSGAEFELDLSVNESKIFYFRSSSLMTFNFQIILDGDAAFLFTQNKNKRFTFEIYRNIRHSLTSKQTLPPLLLPHFENMLFISHEFGIYFYFDHPVITSRFIGLEIGKFSRNPSRDCHVIRRQPMEIRGSTFQFAKIGDGNIRLNKKKNIHEVFQQHRNQFVIYIYTH